MLSKPFTWLAAHLAQSVYTEPGFNQPPDIKVVWMATVRERAVISLKAIPAIQGVLEMA